MRNSFNKFDFVIVGGGMVGLCLAHQIIERGISNSIAIVDKEKKLGSHSSGRNSGVIHSGIYYKNGTTKAKVCVKGAKRLVEWTKSKKIKINECGKVIVPQRLELDKQLDLLLERGIKNGAKVEIIDEKQLKELIPCARTSSGRAIWSPNTKVVNPKEVLKSLENELKIKGVKFFLEKRDLKISNVEKKVTFKNENHIFFGHLINSAGLNADKIAHLCNVGLNYKLLPFKGLYWQIKNNFPLEIKTNLYPVPDLNMPFLGVHFTPNTDNPPKINIGPTATFALGRENYRGVNSIEPLNSLKNLAILTNNYLNNFNGIRKYIHEQAFLSLKPLFIRAAKELVPKLEAKHIALSEKVGIRAQLYNSKSNKLEDDFLLLEGQSSTHILNAISPAFTASFELADLIINLSNFD